MNIVCVISFEKFEFSKDTMAKLHWCPHLQYTLYFNCTSPQQNALPVFHNVVNPNEFLERSYRFALVFLLILLSNRILP